MRIRSVLLLLALAWVVYRLLPASRKATLRGRLQGVGQAVALSIVVYWAWLLCALAWRAWAE